MYPSVSIQRAVRDASQRRSQPRRPSPAPPHEGPVSGPGWRDTIRPTDLTTITTSNVEPARVAGGLAYAGCLHSLDGQPESGKTTLGLHAVALELRAGHTVVVLDEESGPEQTAERLRAFGLDAGDLVRLTYCAYPGLRWTPEQVDDLCEMLDEIRPTLLLVDSSSAFLAAMGAEENDNSAVGSFYQRVLLRAARTTGTAVLVIDHPGRGGDSRYSRGASVKLGLVDVAYKLDRRKPFTRESDGLLRLSVAKDRRGWLVRDHDITVHTGGGQLDLEVTVAATVAAKSDDPLSRTARRVLIALESGPATLHDLAARTGLSRSSLSGELNRLAAAGMVEATREGSAKLWQTRP